MREQVHKILQGFEISHYVAPRAVLFCSGRKQQQKTISIMHTRGAACWLASRVAVSAVFLNCWRCCSQSLIYTSSEAALLYTRYCVPVYPNAPNASQLCAAFPPLVARSSAFAAPR